MCRGPECGDKRGSAALYREFQRRLAGCGVAVDLGWQSCFGRCTQGPNVLVRELAPEEARKQTSLAAPARGAARLTALYNRVTVERVGVIVKGHIVEGRVQRQFVERPRAVESTPIARSRTDGDS